MKGKVGGSNPLTHPLSEFFKMRYVLIELSVKILGYVGYFALFLFSISFSLILTMFISAFWCAIFKIKGIRA